MTDRFAEHRAATRAALLRGSGATSAELRQAVAAGRPPSELSHVVEKVRAHAYRVTDSDLNALRGQYSEDQLFEIIASAAFGAAEERLTAGLRALDHAVGEP